MYNRELETAKGNEWYEPGYWDLNEERSQKETSLNNHECFCGKDILAGEPHIVDYHRTRTWKRKSGMWGEYSEWSKWKEVNRRCFLCN